MTENNTDTLPGESAETISKIDIQYHRNTKIKPETLPEGASWDYLIWDYQERITVDRASETIEHLRNIAQGCSVKSTYYIEEGVAAFLDGIDSTAFSEIEGDPPDVMENPLETRDYVITMETIGGEARTIAGSFDKSGLPRDWPEFISELWDFLLFYGLGEICDPRVYGKEKRRQSDYIFCNVTFEEDGCTYCYLADHDEFREGDLVVVPAGRNNREAVVRIESIEYHQAEDAPFPVERTKHILRKYADTQNRSETER